MGVIPLFIKKNIYKRNMISIPFVDYAGPVLGANLSSFYIYNFLTTYYKISNNNFQIKTINRLKKIPIGLHIKIPRVTFVLSTNLPFEDVWKNSFHRKIRNVVRKTKKNNIEIKECRSIDDIKQYYILHVKTLKKLNSLPFPLEFFYNIWNNLTSNCRITLAFYFDVPIGGLFTFNFKNKMHIWGNVSDPEYLHLSPNNALYSDAINWACDNSYSSVDFGSTVPNTSHHFFKKRWGGEEKPLYVISSKEEDYQLFTCFKTNVKKIIGYFPLNTVVKFSDIYYSSF